MGFGRNVIGVLFWYGVLGGSGAFLYRLIAELARALSPSRTTFQPFGFTAVRILALLDWLPLRLFSLLIILGKQAGTSFKAVLEQSRSWPLPGPALLLCAVGNKLQLALGGPAIYGEQSVRAKILGRIAPSAIHIAQVQSLIAWRILSGLR